MSGDGGVIDTEAIRASAGLVTQGADMVAYAGERLPGYVDASLMSGLIRDEVESVAANLVALIVEFDDMSAKARFAADRYDAAAQVSVDGIKHVMPDADYPPDAYYRSKGRGHSSGGGR